MIGLVLLWVGAVLTLNGLWLMGRIGDREIAVINVFAGGIAFLAAVVSAFRSGAKVTGGIAFGALVLLFAFTYLWIAINRIFQLDGRSLGWYSLFVAITAVPIGIEILMGAQRAWGCCGSSTSFSWCRDNSRPTSSAPSRCSKGS